MAILDVGLPDGDGLALGADLCARLPRRPLLVAVTGFPDRERAARVAGFDHHFLKPVDPSDLRDLLARYAGRQDRIGP